MIKAAGLCVILGIVACSDPRPKTILVDADQTIDGSIVTTTVTINSFGESPRLLAVRDGEGSWSMLPPDAGSVAIEGPKYRLLAVCEHAGTFTTAIAARTLADGPELYRPCFQFATTTPPTTVAMTGQMSTAGTVTLDDTQTSATSAWNFSLDVRPGTHDLVAFDAARILIRRALAITVAGAVPNVDTATGVAFDRPAFTLTDAGADAVSYAVDLLTENGYAEIDGTGATPRIPPASLLTMNELQFVTFALAGAQHYRSADVFYQATSPTTIALLPVLSGITFTGTSASFGALPPGDVTLGLAATNGIFMKATNAWLEDQTTLEIDVSGVPGYLPAYAVATAGVTHRFEVSTTGPGGEALVSGITDGAAVAKRSPGPRGAKETVREARQRDIRWARAR